VFQVYNCKYPAYSDTKDDDDDYDDNNNYNNLPEIW
jgi:hypothetical protein